MKRTIIAILLALALLTAFAACGGSPVEPTDGITATNDPQTISITLTVTLPDGTQTRQELITATAKSTLGEVLDKYGLIERDATGMIVKVQGVEASWENDQAYWSFEIDGQYATHGVDEEIVANGNTYELKYTKG